MVKSFLFAFLIILAVSGVCEFIYVLRMIFYFPNIRVQNYSLVVLKKSYAVKQLNYIWQKIKWHGEEFSSGIIAITDGIETKEFLDCKNFADGKNIMLCTVSSLSECQQLQGS